MVVARFLPARGMARIEIACVTPVRIPARARGAAVAHIRRIQAETGDDSKSMSVARINRNPTAPAMSAVMPKVIRGQRYVQQPRVVQCERNCPGTVIAVIIKRAVPSAPHVRFSPQRIHGPD